MGYVPGLDVVICEHTASEGHYQRVSRGMFPQANILNSECLRQIKVLVIWPLHSHLHITDKFPIIMPKNFQLDKKQNKTK